MVRRALERTLGVDFLLRSEDAELDYQPIQGNAELLREVEQLHNAPCVATVGAKQGVYAALTVAKQRGCRVVGMRNPAWPPLVHAIKTLGMEHTLFNHPLDGTAYDCLLLVSPNNPDGRSYSVKEMQRINFETKKANRFFIHDAAYACSPYTHDPLYAWGDAQVISVSKRFGLSGLRVGWVVSKDEAVLNELQDVVETISAGTCGTAQGAVAKLLRRLRVNPQLRCLFDTDCYRSLKEARDAACSFNPRVLEAVQPLEGAFAWCKKGPKYDVDKLKARLVDGGAYGNSDFVRVNLVGDVEDVRELAQRTHAL